MGDGNSTLSDSLRKSFNDATSYKEPAAETEDEKRRRLQKEALQRMIQQQKQYNE